jgi:uncharacterized protein involved in exopolysaccharide biosynthesis/Mrp family chromosome partitioning ATPase
MKPYQTTQVTNVREVQVKGARSAATAAGSSSFGMTDLAYVFFRHKWKILLCSIAGIGAAIGIFLKYKPDYVSDAKVMIRYVLESRQLGPVDTGEQIRTPDSRGDNIINSEVELITSLDLATEVARKVGATNFVDAEFLKVANTNEVIESAGMAIRRKLEVRVKPKSNVIGISYEHERSRITQLVVTNLVAEYLRLHARVHRATDLKASFDREKNMREQTLKDLEAKLKKLKGDLKIVSVPEAKKHYSDTLARLRSDKLEAEASLAESVATLRLLTNVFGNAQAQARAQAQAQAQPAAPAPVAPEPTSAVVPTVPSPTPVVVPPDILNTYQYANARLEVLRQREQVLLLSFTPTSSYVKRITDQIASTIAERDKLTAEHPALTNAPAAAPAAQGPILVERAQQQQQQPQQQQQQQPQRLTNMDPVAEAAKVDALTAKVQKLTEQLNAFEIDALSFGEQEPRITQLERDILITEKQYNYYAASAEEADVSDAVASSRMSNISVLQNASPPYRATGMLLKLFGAAAFGGIGLGVGLALLIEFVTDRSVRRPKQVVETLDLPLFLSVPKLDLPKAPLPAPGSGSPPAASAPSSQDEEEGLSKYAEALRDRLIMHFQIKDLKHTPKLVGVTSCGRGAGVTTLATSLAASMSETGEGNVLYVDVNQQLKASAHPFRKGKPAVGISEVLGASGRNAAQVGDNLYMVSLGDPNSGRVGVLPKKLASLVPQIRASDYDYIIFDLPPVTQTSIAARVSGLLDITVMVLESEKTQTDLARQAAKLLGESGTDLVTVLNKHERYLPASLDSDL